LCTSAETCYNRLLNVSYKSHLLNTLLRIPPEKRLEEETFAMLTQPEFGGIMPSTVAVMMDLVKVYQGKCMPAEFRKQLWKISQVSDFVVVCYYFNVLTMLERISFIDFDADTIRKTDESMMRHRFKLHPGERLPDSAYDVSIALCCERICTMMGDEKHGNYKVAYNLDKQSFVCIHGKSLNDDNEEDEEENEEEEDDDDNDEGEDAETQMAAIHAGEGQFATIEDLLENLRIKDKVSDAAAAKGRGTKRDRITEERKQVRNHRKRFNKIPCGQPVITINLRGRALIWGNTRQRKKQVMHCPTCGALHIYTVLNFAESETGAYRCNECARKDAMHVQANICAYCQRSATEWLDVLCLGSRDPQQQHATTTFNPILNPDDVRQRLYFCSVHLATARRFHATLHKADMWALIKQAQEIRTMRLVAKTL
jgi:hypothetical protein